MLVSGLSDLILRSQLNTRLCEGVANINASVVLFSGTPPSNLNELEFDEAKDPTAQYQELFEEAGGIVAVNLALVKANGKLSLNVSGGNYAGHREIGGKFFKADPATTVYDISTSAYRPLGEAILYNINNLWSAHAPYGGFPSAVIPPKLSQFDDLKNPLNIFQKNCLSGKAYRLAYQATYWLYNAGIAASTSDSGQNYRAHSIVMFDEPVEADFIIYRLSMIWGAENAIPLSHITLLTESGNVELPVHWAASYATYVYPFTKRKITGIRIGNQYQAHDGYLSFGGVILSAGLKDYTTYPELVDIPRDPFTWGVLIPELDTARQNTNYRLPKMLVSVGGEGSESDIEIKGHDQYYINSDCVVSKTLIELDA